MAKQAPPPGGGKPTSQSDDIERELVQSGLRKRAAGQMPSAREAAAIKRFEAKREEDLRWEYYRSIPQKHWLKMSGRQAKVINEQALTYDLPIDGATIDLPAVVRALHDFLAVHHRKFKQLDEDDELLAGGDSPALERYRDERAKLAKLDRLEREQELLPRDKTHAGLIQIASILRTMGEQLQKKFGPEAQEMVDNALENAARTIEELFGEAS
jgi:hypothetical protein